MNSFLAHSPDALQRACFHRGTPIPFQASDAPNGPANPWAVTCPACGKRTWLYVRDQDEWLAAHNSHKPSYWTMKACPACGHQIATAAKSCPNCGAVFSASAVTVAAWLFIFLVVLALLGGLLAGL